MRDLPAAEFSSEIERDPAAPLLDIRTPRERAIHGVLPGSELCEAGDVKTRAAELAPDPEAPVFAYCAKGIRSARAVGELEELGYQQVIQLRGGIEEWMGEGLPVEGGVGERYSRNAILDQIGWEGQRKLSEARVLVVGLGGLGSPVALYLAAAGVGSGEGGALGLLDDDVVDLSNLQRQILHTTNRVGEPKVQSARTSLRELNPELRLEVFEERLGLENRDRILAGWDVIVDGADNFPVRYLINDFATGVGVPVVSASIVGFTGQLSVFGYEDGPCYRCLYPTPPPPEMSPNCADAGVIGALAGVIGSMQALEVVKIITGAGQVAAGELLVYEALDPELMRLKVRRREDCPACGDGRDEGAFEEFDYVEFCGVGR